MTNPRVKRYLESNRLKYNLKGAENFYATFDYK